jgi:PBP1b-binding outer membrane lipoprotein LpoB
LRIGRRSSGPFRWRTPLSQRRKRVPIAPRLKSWLSVALIALVLTGCGTAASSPTSTLTVQTRCPPLVKYTKDFQAQAAKELETLPHGSATQALVNDYLRLRDICRKINLP